MGILLFALYHFLITQLPIETFGVWSLVMATVSFCQTANFGVAKSLMHFVPRALGDNDPVLAVKFIETMTITIFFVFIVLGAALYIPAQWMLGSVIEGASLQDALDLLPWAFASLVISNIGLVSLSGLRALHRGYNASIFTILGGVVQFVAALILVPDYGIISMGWAQLLQSIVIWGGSWVLLVRALPGTPYFVRRFDRTVFMRSFKYGLKLQAISLIVMFIQPTTKYLLGIYGSLAAVGYFEFAERMLQRFAKLVTQSTLVLVPVLSDLSHKQKDKIRDLLVQANSVVFFLSPVLMFGLMAGMQGIAWLWLKDPYAPFVLYACILATAMVFNLIASPAFNLGHGTGELGANVTGIAINAATNVIFGLALGSFFGAVGVVVGLALSNVCGNLYILIMNMKRVVGWRFVTARLLLSTIVLVLACMMGVVAAHKGFDHFWPSSPWVGVGVTILCITFSVALVMWMHPGFRIIWREIYKPARQPVSDGA